MASVMERSREKRQQQQDEEFIRMSGALEKAAEKQRVAEAECVRLQRLLDDSLGQFQRERHLQLQHQLQLQREKDSATTLTRPSTSASAGDGWSGAVSASQSWRSLVGPGAGYLAPVEMSEEEKGEEEEGLQRRSRRTVRERKDIVASVAEDKEGQDEDEAQSRPRRVRGTKNEVVEEEVAAAVSDAMTLTVEDSETSQPSPRPFSASSPLVATSPSKFINPLRNRLKDLIKTVEVRCLRTV